jgi:hypothetical protein
MLTRSNTIAGGLDPSSETAYQGLRLATTVPEPSAVGLVMLGALIVACGRKTRSAPDAD